MSRLDAKSGLEGEDYSRGYTDGLKSHDRKLDRLRQEFERQIEELQDDFKHRLDTLTRKIERSERDRDGGRGDGETEKRAVRAIVDQFNNFWRSLWSQPEKTEYEIYNSRMQYPPGY